MGAALPRPVRRPGASLVPLLLTIAIVAQSAPDPSTYDGRSGQLTVDPPRIESPSISVDARLDEPEWAEAARLTGFTQYTPVEGAAASQDTEVRLFYSSDAIYFGFHLYDSDPDQILVHLLERDRSQSDDWIRIMLDTYNDERQAYTFFISPYGIQSDGMWDERIEPRGDPTGPRVDFSQDFIYDSHGRIVDDGWVVEVRIPFVSLRFPERPVQDWGLQIARGVMRNGFKSSWAPLTVEESSVLGQSGMLRGLRDLQPQRLIELYPEATGKIEGFRQADVFERGDLEPDLGLNGRIGITQNLVLDATINPDFSQVEADRDQIQVNERFALFFPETRRFFLDGAEIFRSNQNLVHTRSIVDPIAGAKMTGKVGAFSVGYLGALDESPSSIYDGDGSAIFNVLRARADVGSGSTLGVVLTDRSLTEGGGFNRVASADARLLLGGRYTVASQLTGSWTSNGGPGSAPSLEPAISLNVARSGLNFSYSARLADMSPDFVTRTGYAPRVGETDWGAAIGFDRFGAPGALVETWGLELQSNNFSKHDDFWAGRKPFEYEIELHPNIALRGNRRASGILKWGGFIFQPEDYAAHEVVGAGGAAEPYPLPPSQTDILGVMISPNVRFNETFNLSGALLFREIPLFAEGSLGWENRISPNLRIQPGEALNIEAGYTWVQLSRRSDGSHFSTAHIQRLRIQYQFNRALLVRLLGQYDLEERVALRHPVTGQQVLIGGVLQDARERGDFTGQALIQYEPAPGRILFVGYSRAMNGPYGYQLGEKDLVQDGLFVKLSYLFRM